TNAGSPATHSGLARSQLFEAVEARQRREQEQPDCGDRDRGGAACDHGRDRADQGGCCARFERAEPVGRADEDPLDRVDAPAAIAPTAGALRKMPSPAGPVCRIERANTGKSATAPPKRTANRSSRIAPRTTRERRRKLIPPSTCARSGGSSRPGTQPPRRA